MVDAMPENPAEEPTAASAAPNPEAVPDAVEHLHSGRSRGKVVVWLD